MQPDWSDCYEPGTRFYYILVNEKHTIITIIIISSKIIGKRLIFVMFVVVYFPLWTVPLVHWMQWQTVHWRRGEGQGSERMSAQSIAESNQPAYMYIHDNLFMQVITELSTDHIVMIFNF